MVLIPEFTGTPLFLYRAKESPEVDCISFKDELDEQDPETVRQECGETRESDGVGQGRNFATLFHKEKVSVYVVLFPIFDLLEHTDWVRGSLSRRTYNDPGSF